MKPQQIYYHLNETSNDYYQFPGKEILEQQRDKLLKKYYAAIKNGQVFKNVKRIYLEIKKINQDLKDLEMKEKVGKYMNA